jgi:hypothetical protein
MSPQLLIEIRGLVSSPISPGHRKGGVAFNGDTEELELR